MPGLLNYGCLGTLTIGGVSMNRPAWDLVDVSPLWLTGDVRGEDRILPGLTGVRSFKRRRTVTSHTLRLLVCGTVDRLGAVNADPLVGLYANLVYLRANVADPTGTGDGTRAAVLTKPGGGTLTGPVTVEGITEGQIAKGTNMAGEDEYVMRCTLRLTVPAGVLV